MPPGMDELRGLERAFPRLAAEKSREGVAKRRQSKTPNLRLTMTRLTFMLTFLLGLVVGWGLE